MDGLAEGQTVSLRKQKDCGRIGSRTYFFALTCLLVVFAYFFSRLTSSATLAYQDNCILGADAHTYYQNLLEGDWGIFRFRKHAMSVLASGVLMPGLSKLGVPLTIAIPAMLSAVTAVGAAALFLVLRLQQLSNTAALFVVLAFLSTFGTVTVFSVVETYAFTFATVAIAMLLFTFLGRLAEKRVLVAGIAAGLVGAAPGWANLPAVAFILFYSGIAWGNIPGSAYRKGLLAAALPITIAVTLSLIPMVYADAAKGFSWQMEYVERYASFSNFTTWNVFSNYILNYFVFSLVSPVDVVKSAYHRSDLWPLTTSPMRLVTWLAAISLLGFGILRATCASGTRPLAVAILTAAAGLFGFYLYFNPVEAVLYSSQWALALFVAAGLGYRAKRPAAWLFGALFVVLIAVNAPPLDNPHSMDPASCLAAKEKPIAEL